MLELIILILAIGGVREVAKRRGSAGWPFVAAMLVGYFVFGYLGALLVGPGPDLLFTWGWVGLCYVSVVFLTGGGRRVSSSWQCPECQFHNEPTTLICPCGYRYPDEG